jgi:hypothetical protein
MVDTKKKMYAEIARKMRAIPQEKSDPSHEWEELVEKMCASDDAGLQDIGNKEHEALSQLNLKRKEMKK